MRFMKSSLFGILIIILIAISTKVANAEQSLVTQIVSTSGGESSYVLKADGTVWAWGDNRFGQLGDGTTTYRYNPVQVAGLTGVKALFPLYPSCYALKIDGTLWSWGYNNDGQLGDGTKINRCNPVQVTGLSGVKSVNGRYAVKEDGSVWNWGGSKLTPEPVSYFNGEQDVYLTGVKEIIGRYALKEDGTVWAWGSNLNGELGDGTYSYSSDPVQVLNLTNVKTVIPSDNCCYALKEDGTVWSWGSGYLGDGTNIKSNVPVQVLGLTGVNKVLTKSYAGDVSSYALKDDGTVWAWGNNLEGRLGIGNTTNSNSPVQVIGISEINNIFVFDRSCYALKADGTLWSWGYNWNGQLGDGTNINRYSPVQVKDITGVKNLFPNNYNCYAITEDGTVWAWGSNDDGQLGDGTNIARYSPVQVKDLYNVKQMLTPYGEGRYALKDDGTLWAWGYNGSGQLGIGTTNNQYIPIETLATLPSLPESCPIVTQTNPGNTASAVGVSVKPSVTFSKTIVQGIKFTDIKFTNTSGELLSLKSITLNEDTLVIEPLNNLHYDTNYIIDIPAAAVKTQDGYILVEPYTFNFTTKVYTPTPETAASDPLNNATNIPINKTLTITFSEDILAGDNLSGIRVETGGTQASFSSSLSGLVLTIDPETDLEYGQEYNVFIPAGAVKDVDGNASEIDFTFTFTTEDTPITDITLNQTATTLIMGGSNAILVATLNPSNASNKAVTWTSSNTSVCTVNNDGVVTPTGVGAATITVTSAINENKSAVCTITVLPASEYTYLNQSSLSLSADSSPYQLSATVLPSGSDQSVIWSSDNETVATVLNGLVTPHTSGKAVITAISVYGNHSATCMVTVISANVSVTGITFDKTTLTLSEWGEPVSLNATILPENATNKGINWSSSDNSVATVTGGIITPRNPGTSVVFASTQDGGYAAICNVNVNEVIVSVTSISISSQSEVIDTPGGTLQMNAVIMPSGATNSNMTWSVIYGTGTATIDSSGLLTAKSNGTVTVRATAIDGSGVMGSKQIVISNQPEVIPFTVSVSLKIGSDRSPTSLIPNQLLEAVANISNVTEVSQPALIIVALYDSYGSMVNVSYVSKTLEAHMSETLHTGFKLPENIDGYQARVFIWDGTDLESTTMKPLSNVITIFE